jgi:ATP-dependent DNA ligase
VSSFSSRTEYSLGRLDLEGIVAKKKTDAYRPETVWYKIKSRTYTQGEGRW